MHEPDGELDDGEREASLSLLPRCTIALISFHDIA
jgi:hypothetical protein